MLFMSAQTLFVQKFCFYERCHVLYVREVGVVNMKIAILDDELESQDILEKYIHEWAEQNHELVDIHKYESAESFLFCRRI